MIIQFVFWGGGAYWEIFPVVVTFGEHGLTQRLSVSPLQDFSYDDAKVEFNVDAPNGVVMEGYLFKRASNAFKTWNR